MSKHDRTKLMVAPVQSRHSLYAGMLLVAAWGIISRLLGFIRDQVTGIRFGVGQEFDAYTLGMTAPQILGNMFTAPIAAAALPVFTQIVERQGEQAASYFTKRLLLFVSGLSMVLGLIGVGLTSQFLGASAPGLAGSAWSQAWTSSALGYAAVPFLVVAAVLKADLDRRGLYGTSVVQPVFLNGAAIIVLLFSSNPSVSILALGLTIGAVLHASWQVYSVFPYWGESRQYPAAKDWARLLKLATPVILGVLISQVNVVVDRRLAYEYAAGSVGALGLADRVRQLPYGILVASIYTTAFPQFSSLAARGSFSELRDELARALWLTLIALLPFVLILTLGPRPIIQVAFQHGRFDAVATQLTAVALAGYAPGLLGMGWSQMLMGVYYAHNRTGRALAIATVANVINIILDPPMATLWGHTGIALANTVAVSLQVVGLWVFMPLDTRPRMSLRKVVGVALAGSICGAMLIAGNFLTTTVSGLGELPYWIAIYSVSLVGYILVLWVAGVTEVVDIVRIVSRKVGALKR